MIAESQKAVDEAEEFLLGLFDRARISGKGVLDDSPGCSENLVNEINIISPDVIASFLPSPAQEKDVYKRQLINSGFYDLATAYQSVHVNY